MTDPTPPKKISPSILNALNKAAFKGSARDIKKAFIECDYDELIGMFPHKPDLYAALKDIALNERADTFRVILFKFKNDEDGLSAIIDGFNADERYARNHNSDSWGTDPDPKDLEKKREAMRDLAIELSKAAKAGNNPQIPAQRNIGPRGPRFGN